MAGRRSKLAARFATDATRRVRAVWRSRRFSLALGRMVSHPAGRACEHAELSKWLRFFAGFLRFGKNRPGKRTGPVARGARFSTLPNLPEKRGSRIAPLDDTDTMVMNSFVSP
jgi:hypothetical protein